MYRGYRPTVSLWLPSKALHHRTRAKGGPLEQPLDTLAKKCNVSPSAIFLSWYNQQNVVVITTTQNPNRLKEYQQALTFKLSPSEMEEITQIELSHHYQATK